MGLLTAHYLVQYIKENSTGLTEGDFSSIGIDDFIRHWYLTSETYTKYNLRKLLDSYQDHIIREARAEIMAKDIKSVDSTDEEYEAFVEAFFNAAEGEIHGLGSTDGLDVYNIVTADEQYQIRIGRTKNIDHYDIRNTGFYVTYEIYLPSGDMQLRTGFCYSSNEKFFLIVIPHGKGDDSEHEIYKLFTQVKQE